MRRTAERRSKTLILETLARLAQDGIDPETVAAALNTVEFSLRENNTGSFPRGLVADAARADHLAVRRRPARAAGLRGAAGGDQGALAGGRALLRRADRAAICSRTRTARRCLQPDPGCTARQEAAEAARWLAPARAMSHADLEAMVENTPNAQAACRRRPTRPRRWRPSRSCELADLDRRTSPSRSR